MSSGIACTDDVGAGIFVSTEVDHEKMSDRALS